MKEIVKSVENSYENLVIREVVKEAFYKINSIREEYKISCAGFGMKKSLVKTWMRNQLILLCPITPHICESIYQEIKEVIKEQGDSELVLDLRFPEVEVEQSEVLKQYEYVSEVGKNLRSTYERFQKKNQNKEIKKIYILVAQKYQEWQEKILKMLSQENGTENWQEKLKEVFKSEPQMMKKAMAFASFKIQEFNLIGKSAFETQVSFQEEVVLKKQVRLLIKEVVDEKYIEIVEQESA